MGRVSCPLLFSLPRKIMTSTTRATLLDRLRDASDAVAWEEFFRLYGPAIYAFARCAGGSDTTAQEVVQEVMLSVFQRRDVFRYDPAKGRFRDWLRTVVRNKLAELRRRPAERIRARGGEEQPGFDEPQAADAPPDQAWEELFEHALLAALLEVLRQEMNPRTYQAFELLVLHELPGDQVARITGLTRNAVYLARGRAIGRLKQLGESYRDQGELAERLRRSMQLRPDESVERALSQRVEQTMRSRWESPP
jgi:RNA polymerase sigma-70 factor (ECF subfamily)